MNNNNTGVLLTAFVCCGWPLIFHFAITRGLRYIAERDWSNLQWHQIKFPWSKDQ